MTDTKTYEKWRLTMEEKVRNLLVDKDWVRRHLVRLDVSELPAWAIDYTGSEVEDYIKGLFDTTVVVTPFNPDYADIHHVVNRITAINKALPTRNR